MAKRLMEIANQDKISIDDNVYLDKQYRYKNEELKLIEKFLYGFSKEKKYEEPKHIHLFLAENPYSEIENVAKEIIKLVKEKGYCFRDISVITKNIEESGPLIKAIFRSYEIPNFIDEKKNLSDNIFIRFILSVLQILGNGWTTENVLSSIKTGFYPITKEEQYQLENYVLAWGIKGKAWYEKDWEYGFENKEEKEKINLIRNKIVLPIINLKKELSGQKTVKDVCTKLFEFLKNMGAQECMQEKIDRLLENSEIEAANEYILGMKITTEILDEMVTLLGENNISFEKQLELLKIGFSGNILGTIPATLDEVIVGDIDRSRSHKVKAVFIIGLNDGVFPEVRKDEGFLNDEDRAILNNMGIEMANSSLQSLYEEQFSIYKAFSVAEEELYLSYPTSDKEGASLRPSSLISKIKRLFPNLKEKSEAIEKELYIANKKVTFENLLYYIQKAKNDGKQDKTWQTVYEIYKDDIEWKNKLNAAMQGLYDTNLPVKLKNENIKKLYGNTLKTSVSRLEQYRKCPFSFHLKYGLKLKEPKVFNLQAVDTGSFMHEVIAEFFDFLEEENLNYRKINDDELKQIVSKIVEKQLQLTKNELFNSTPKFQSLTRRLEKVILKSIKYIIEQLKDSDFDIARNRN